MVPAIKCPQHIALAIGEEVDLHTRLLDDLEEGVEVQQTRMKAATLKVGCRSAERACVLSHWMQYCTACVQLCPLLYKSMVSAGLLPVAQIHALPTASEALV